MIENYKGSSGGGGGGGSSNNTKNNTSLPDDLWAYPVIIIGTISTVVGIALLIFEKFPHNPWWMIIGLLSLIPSSVRLSGKTNKQAGGSACVCLGVILLIVLMLILYELKIENKLNFKNSYLGSIIFGLVILLVIILLLFIYGIKLINEEI
jgi:hypothetical protein